MTDFIARLLTGLALCLLIPDFAFSQAADVYMTNDEATSETPPPWGPPCRAVPL
jgi:hypothetical protein